MDFAQIGYAAAVALAAVGSALGAGVAGMAACGAWKRCYAENKPAPFILIAFVGAPLTQTIYGMILMNTIFTSAQPPAVRMGAGIFGGLALGVSAWYQGRAGASAADAQASTGKGFANYMMVLGLVETTAIFTLVFLLVVLQQAA